MKIHHKVAAAIIQDRKLLMVRKYDEPHFILPGGKPKQGETTRQTLEREVLEELGVKLLDTDFFEIKEAPHFRDADTIVRMEVYLSNISGEPRASGEINEFRWIDSQYEKQGIRVASINGDYIIPMLHARGLID